MSSYSYPYRTLQLIYDTYRHVLADDAPLTEPPQGSLKVPLRAHQQAVLHAMEKHEKESLNGMDCSGERLYSSYGILGDSVGVGKSLMVLGHIARLSVVPPLQQRMRLGDNSTDNVFSIKSQNFTDLSEGNAMIIVPHTLYRQWADYIKKQTNLDALYLDKKKVFQSETLAQDVLRAKVVLISNTLYKEFSMWQERNKVRWKRVFIDEADTIHLTNGYPLPPARFVWFVTASWMNLIFPNESLYIPSSTLQTQVFAEGAPYATLAPIFKDTFNALRPYTYLRHYMTSFNLFRNILNTNHKLRGRLVIRCSEEFIKKSISLPHLSRQNILCKAPLTQRIVSDVVSSEIQQLLHGGDTAGAIAALGVKSEDTTSLIDAVTKTLKKELERLQATYTFKASLEYATVQSKETALKSLEDKIKQKEGAIKTIEERIEGFKHEMCPICYDDPQEPLVTPCCARIFCAQCILNCLVRQPTCPMCREQITPSKLKKVVDKNDAVNTIVESGSGAGGAGEPEEEQILMKPATLLRLFKQYPAGRFLVFSRYDNPFSEMETEIESLGVRVKQLKGNKDAIAATLRAFQGGDLRCLLLNSYHAGSGLNITAATHVVLLHAMTHEEEKQILGRAYRLGRTEPLQFIRLLHENEFPVTG